jgi:hypothetical protein
MKKVINKLVCKAALHMKFDCKKMHPKCKAECCGIVPIPKETFEKHKDKIKDISLAIIDLDDHVVFETNNHYCPFLSDDLQCKIYEDRPPICRKFGDESHPLMCCPVLDKNGKERTDKERKKVTKSAEKFINKLRILVNGK